MAPVARSQSRAAGSATLPQSEMAPIVTPSGSRSTAAQSLRRHGMLTTDEVAAAYSSVAHVVAAAAEAAGTTADSIGAQVAIAAAEETAAADSIGAQMVAKDSTDSTEKTTVGAFVPNSPIRKPRLVEYDSDGEELSEPSFFPDPVQYAEYKEAEQIYSENIGELMKLPTLDNNTCIDAELIQEKAEDTILKAAKFVLGLSSYIDGVLLNNCSGILIWWDKGTGTILTTADLLCSSSPNLDDWLGGKEYAANAEVSGESNAEKLGVRMGDIVQSVNGKCIATAVEVYLENMMLDICKDHLEKGTGIETDADVMVTLGVFNTTKRVSGEIELTAKLSQKVEIIATGIHLLSTLNQPLAQ
nr:unnamed protein product [Digitaria exilis]